MSQVKREQKTYSVLMLDIDYFKSINDTYGHDTGDKVIIKVGELLKETIRESDLAIRYGGEEFVLMLYNADENGTQKVAKNIHEQFSQIMFDVGHGKSIHKTISIGIANFPNDGDTLAGGIKLADTALYKAKTTGRNKIVTYSADMIEDKNV